AATGRDLQSPHPLWDLLRTGGHAHPYGPAHRWGIHLFPVLSNGAPIHTPLLPSRPPHIGYARDLLPSSGPVFPRTTHHGQPLREREDRIRERPFHEGGGPPRNGLVH